MNPLRLALPAVVSLAIAVTTPAAGHEYWLALAPWTAGVREDVSVHAFAGIGLKGEGKPYASSRVVRFVARTGVLIDLRDAASTGDMAWARFAPSDRGGALFAYESSFAANVLPAEAFDAYLKEDGLDEPLAIRRSTHDQRPGRERYRRCAKAWLGGDDAARATRPLGMPLEIVPITPPHTDSPLRIVLLWEGKPLGNALVNAWHAPLDSSDATSSARPDLTEPSISVRTDREGRAVLPIAAPGQWLVSTVHMVPCREPDDADWESTWASLSFARLGH